MDPFKRRKLGTSDVMLPQLGFGGAPLGELYVKISEADSMATMAAAWDAGIRYYDTAPWYGRGAERAPHGRRALRQAARTSSCVSTKIGRLLSAPVPVDAAAAGTGPAACPSTSPSTTATTR